ncbi:MAG: glycosyltransferase family 39 protein [Spirulina sp. DLM2.Bin59]|nr:MAG: glycosyltransferase family 39 protein [Spirulina sp. DLM2.Bin59]
MALALGLICTMALLWRLGSIGLIDETEPLFAEASRQMVATGDWVTPYFNGETRFDKPPLVYWLMALGYLVLGVNEWAVRLPSALGAIALIILLFFTLRRYGYALPRITQEDLQSRLSQRQRWLAAGLGAAILTLNLQFIVWARTGVSDMLLCAGIGLSLLWFFWGYVEDEGEVRPGFWPRPAYLGCYLAMAGAVLAKGPVGIVIPGLVILSFLAYMGNLKTVWQEAKVWSGAVIFAVLTIPWYVLVILAHGQTYIDDFFGYHNVDRFTQVVNNHSGPWYFYFLVVAVGFFPWSLGLPVAMARLRFWGRSPWQAQPRRAHLGILALIWFGVIFLFFTIAVTKLPSYTLPLLPAAAILIALFWTQALTLPPTPPRRWNHSLGEWLTGTAHGVLALIAGGVWWILPWILGPDSAAPNFPAVLMASGLPAIGGLIWLITGIVTLILLGKNTTRRWIVVVNLLAFCCFVSFVVVPTLNIVDQERQQPLRELSLLAQRVKEPTEELLMIGFMKPSVAFYSQRPIRFFSHGPHAVQALQQEVGASTLLVISHPEAMRELGLIPEDYQVLRQSGAYQLTRVQRGGMMDPRNP